LLPFSLRLDIDLNEADILFDSESLGHRFAPAENISASDRWVAGEVQLSQWCKYSHLGGGVWCRWLNEEDRLGEIQLAGYLLHLTGKLIGMQYFDEIARGLGVGRGAAKDFAAFVAALFEAQDDVADVNESGGIFEIRQATWKLMADVGDYHPACAKILEGLFEGLAAGCRHRTQ